MKSYRDLDIYIESKKLAIAIHEMTLTLPRFEWYEEGSQIRKSSKSITSMIVEGYGRRRYRADFVKFLVYAQSECDETLVHLNFLFETGSLSDSEMYRKLSESYDVLSKKINRFTTWVETSISLPGKPAG